MREKGVGYWAGKVTGICILKEFGRVRQKLYNSSQSMGVEFCTNILPSSEDVVQHSGT